MADKGEKIEAGMSSEFPASDFLPRLFSFEKWLIISINCVYTIQEGELDFAQDFGEAAALSR
ncbi:MAG: hypothetical protein K6E38_04175 [Fretibacterium sp.]|nr:hypothetical protein [Fretibacterium sp.]